MPRSYQVTPEVLGRRRATQARPVRPGTRHRRLESARRQPENQPQRSDVTAQTRATLPVTGVCPSIEFSREGRAASAHQRAIGARLARASVRRQQRRRGCSYPCDPTLPSPRLGRIIVLLLSSRERARRWPTTRQPLWTTSSRAVSPFCPSVVHRHSMGAPTPAAPHSHSGLRFRNRLKGATTGPLRPTGFALADST
jgi:hypothetical protein